MNLYYMRQEVMEDLKNNAKSNLDLYLGTTNNWILEKFENPFLEFKRSVADFKLGINQKDIGASDIDNVKILHSNLKDLTKTELADERFWAGLSHFVFWDYMKARWESRPVSNERDIVNRYFLPSGISHRRSLLLNTLSRLWWIGDLLYMEENQKDPYYLLEAFKGDFTTNMHTFLSSNFTSNPKIVGAVLRPTLKYKKDKGKLSRKDFQGIVRHANILGGSYLLDYLDGEEIEEKISLYIESVIKQEED